MNKVDFPLRLCVFIVSLPAGRQVCVKSSQYLRQKSSKKSCFSPWIASVISHIALVAVTSGKGGGVIHRPRGVVNRSVADASG
jgi:hypothetical protein